MIAVMGIFSGVLSIVEGILGIRAANDMNKIMPVWILSIISLIGSVVTIIFSITQGTFGSNVWSYLLSLAASGAMFWIANNIKTQARR
jgi:hypothetical protein